MESSASLFGEVFGGEVEGQARGRWADVQGQHQQGRAGWAADKMCCAAVTARWRTIDVCEMLDPSLISYHQILFLHQSDDCQKSNVKLGFGSEEHSDSDE